MDLFLKLLFAVLPLVTPRLNGNVSTTKCTEYGQWVFADEWGDIDRSVSQCSLIEMPLIVGGQRASREEFPHMAVIGFGVTANDVELAWFCGGSLISEYFVLTAAHCTRHREKGEAQRVRLGTIDLIKDHPSNYQEVIIAERIRHPDYGPHTKYNDIALLRLAEMVVFSANIRPACLCIDEAFEWSSAVAIGFGRLSYDHDYNHHGLMKVYLTSVSSQDCNRVYEHMRAMNRGVLKSQFCAGMEADRDTCQGDSGGPLQVEINQPYCMYSVIGITSVGRFCGFANSPGIYTRVASYVDWIEHIVWL